VSNVQNCKTLVAGQLQWTPLGSHLNVHHDIYSTWTFLLYKQCTISDGCFACFLGGFILAQTWHFHEKSKE
jgi:hypothetical protein